MTNVVSINNPATTAMTDSSPKINNASANGGDLLSSFRQKAAFMKSWKPSSTPSNRDRLELYAWHKQAISGDAPTNLNNMNASEKAKYNAWKTKLGIATDIAMRGYMSESERQVRVYGYTTNSNSNTTVSQVPASVNETNTANPSRGLAAIPLLCAAASEQRVSYLRRLQNTNVGSAWWKRQEALTAVPGSIAALPETTLLMIASFVEYLSLSANACVDATNNNNKNANNGSTATTNAQKNLLSFLGHLPPPVCGMIQSALWPCHNSLLAVWMGIILVGSVVTGTGELLKTMCVGSVQSGRTLPSIWADDVAFAAGSVRTLSQSHQPLSARVVGLVLQPLSILVGILSNIGDSNHLTMSLLYCTVMLCTWWYWITVIPFMLCVGMVASTTVLGGCFGLIELAAQI